MEAPILETLITEAAAFGLRIEPATVEKFGGLLRGLQATRNVLNLTSIRDDEAIVQRHFVDSIRLGVCLEARGLFEPGTRLLDLGSGAGFPGLPLKLVWPDLEVVLLEATAKKARFIQAFVDGLHLSGTQVINERAETLGHRTNFRETQDVVVSRAVAALPALVELALPLLRVGGTLAALKGSRAAHEQIEAKRALEVCGGLIEATLPLRSETPTEVVLIRKASATPNRYPRRSGQPAAHPLH